VFLAGAMRVSRGEANVFSIRKAALVCGEPSKSNRRMKLGDTMVLIERNRFAAALDSTVYSRPLIKTMVSPSFIRRFDFDGSPQTSAASESRRRWASPRGHPHRPRKKHIGARSDAVRSIVH